MSPRPFWTKKDVKVYNNYCEFDFSNPSEHMYNMFFFYGYSIFMYQIKYKEIVNWKIVFGMYALLSFMVFVLSFGMYTFGILFMYQAFVTIIYTISYALACINYDE